MQFLAEAFARRERELRQQGQRQQEINGHRRREDTTRYLSRNDFSSSDEHRPSRHDSPSSPPEEAPHIKREPFDKPSPQEWSNVRSESQLAMEPTSSSTLLPSDLGICICPIGFECKVKHSGLIDCRTLVQEKQWKNWRRRFREEYNSGYA